MAKHFCIIDFLIKFISKKSENVTKINRVRKVHVLQSTMCAVCYGVFLVCQISRPFKNLSLKFTI